MSFRRRLTLFFVLIVVVPMVSLAILLFRLTSDIEAGRVDAAVGAQAQTVALLYEQAETDAGKAIPSGIGSDPQLSEALREEDCEAARERLPDLVDREGIARVSLVDETGDEVCVAGAPGAIAPGDPLALEGPSGASVGALQVSVTHAAGFQRRVRRLVGTGLAVCIDNRQLASSPEGVGCPPPGLRTIEVQGQDLRVRTFAAEGFGSERVVLSVLADPSQLPGASPARVGQARLVVAAILLGFFLLALAFALAVSRQLHHLHEAVERESVTDALTELSNRRRFEDVLKLEGERWRRGGDPVALVMLDIDDFKAVNTTWGLKGGDEVLREVGRVLRARPRAIDESARWGGEEFAVVLAATDLEGAYRLAEQLRKSIEKLQVSAVDGGRAVRVTASFGVASLPECARDEQSLMAAADGALLEAKRTGKNRTVRAPRISSEGLGSVKQRQA